MGLDFFTRKWVLIFSPEMGPDFFTRKWVLIFSPENGSIFHQKWVPSLLSAVAGVMVTFDSSTGRDVTKE